MKKQKLKHEQTLRVILQLIVWVGIGYLLFQKFGWNGVLAEVIFLAVVNLLVLNNDK